MSLSGPLGSPASSRWAQDWLLIARKVVGRAGGAEMSGRAQGNFARAKAGMQRFKLAVSMAELRSSSMNALLGREPADPSSAPAHPQLQALS